MSYIKWEILKERINVLNTNKFGINLIDDIKNNLTHYPLSTLLEYKKNLINIKNPSPIEKYTLNFIEQVVALREKYYIRTPYYNILSVKLQLPSICPAKCPFCYFSKAYENSAVYGKNAQKEFLENYINSLWDVVNKSGDKPLSLDITGGEPTSSLDFLNDVITGLKNNKELLSKFKRVTLTTNSFQIKEALPIIKDVVNYVNISLHSTDYIERTNIFGFNKILTNEELSELVVEAYEKYNIKVSSVFVLDNLTQKEFNRINDWCIKIGFVTNRIRFNVFSDSHQCEQATELMNNCYKTYDYTKVYGESEKEASFYISYYKGQLLTFVMSGIVDTVDSTYGIGVNILTDGKPYLDFDKKLPMNDFPLPLKYVMCKI